MTFFTSRETIAYFFTLAREKDIEGVTNLSLRAFKSSDKSGDWPDVER